MLLGGITITSLDASLCPGTPTVLLKVGSLFVGRLSPTKIANLI